MWKGENTDKNKEVEFPAIETNDYVTGEILKPCVEMGVLFHKLSLEKWKCYMMLGVAW